MPAKQRPRKTTTTPPTNNRNRYEIGVRKRRTNIRNVQNNPPKSRPTPGSTSTRVNRNSSKYNSQYKFGKGFRHPNTWRSEMHKYRVNNVPPVSTLKDSVIELLNAYGGLHPWKYNKSITQKRKNEIQNSIQNYRKGKLKELKTKITSRGVNPSARHINTAMYLPPMGIPYKYPRKSRYYNKY